MKRIQKRLGSLLIAAVMLLSMAVTPAMAADTQNPPTEVKNCEASGFWVTVLALDFADTAWMNKISAVSVNGTNYTKGTISSFSSETKIWEVGNFTGSYGDYTALKLALEENVFSNTSKSATVQISADGYKSLTVQVTKNGYSYSATVVQGSTPVESTYTVTVASDIQNGKLEVSSTIAKQGDTVTVTATPADGFELETLTVKGKGTDVKVTQDESNVNKYTFTMPGEDVTVSAAFKASTPAEDKTIAIDDITFTTDSFGNTWEVSFDSANSGYAGEITAVSVNGTPWEKKDYTPNSGGQYKISEEKLLFARNSYGSTAALKSGDVITITADGYKDLTFKLVIDEDGKASVTADDGKGDPYTLHVKIEGSFEAAIVGQTDYDGVSSASTGASSNKNSAVKVSGALVKKGTEPAKSDWEELNNLSKIKLDGSKCSVSIVPDTENGTKDDADSGMKGVYMPISSDLTLSGTPKDAGSYLISVHIEDNQGRKADSNTLPFRIYTGEETLADQISTENLKQYESGLYAWDIMEPWAIKNFGSNVEGQKNSVRVPKDLEVWFGSHTSGTYGYLGYDIPWKQVKAGDIPQTLYIPNGCDLTLTNMEILSSVRIVVEDGGKLTLSDSVVQGIIDVQSGGTFSMNYDAFNKKFTTGASICGQLRMESGSTLENAAIYSHANYLANGDLTDRTTYAPVVTTTGNVTVKGQVFIRGDDAGGTEKGQTALKVKDGTLTLEDGAVLATYGGDGKTQVYTDGGSAIELDNGTISGNGKVIALGGSVLFGSGSSAVSGNGTIATTEAYIQGATAYEHNMKAQPGKSHDASVSINSNKKYVANGTLVGATANDPLADLYWKTGIDAAPDLSKYEIPANSGYVLMNIPYAEFYAAEKDNTGTAAEVDAVSSATKQKTRSNLAAGSYHKNADGSDISGVIYPVYVADLSVLSGCKQVLDTDSISITVTLRGEEKTTKYIGKDTLFENPDHAYYVLSEAPTYYKTLTVAADGSFSFGKTNVTEQSVANGKVSLITGGRHTYYELKVSGDLPKDIASMVSAVTLHTTDNQTYGLRHVTEIWRGTELGFADTGVYAGLQGRTIDKITYYLNDGMVRTISTSTKVPVSTKSVKAAVASALNTAHETTVTVTLPQGFEASYAVTKGTEDLRAYSFTVAGDKLTWTGTPAHGSYTLTITDETGAFAPVQTTFVLSTETAAAKYDADGKKLVKADDTITDEAFATYLAAITEVSVDGKSYAATGRALVTIVDAQTGAIDLTAAPFHKGEGASYALVVTATGYPDLSFTLSTAKKSNSGSGSGSSGSSSSNAVSVPSTKNGDVTVSPKTASKGATVTVTVKPDSGYELDTITVKDANGNTVKLTDKGDGKYTFTMPTSKVTVSAEFSEIQTASSFADVPADAYYTKAVEWAVKNGVTNGKSNGLFGSNDPCTRGQIVTFLWRAAGSPEPKNASSNFADVSADSYYAKAVAWAVENGITSGTGDGKFSPNATCTRGQAVTFLYRAVGKAPSTVSSFTDVAADAFCADAVAWAVENGVTLGTTDTTFSPNNGCTRAQIVTFLYRAYQGE